MNRSVVRSVRLVLLTCTALALPALGGNAPLPGNSQAFGQSAGEWLTAYWGWYYTGEPLPTDANGNTVVGKVVFLAIPPTPGDGTPGQIDLTLSSGESFVLPLDGVIGFDYGDGVLDPLEDINVFKTLEITVKVDNVVVINQANVMDYYSVTYWNPPLYVPAFDVTFAFHQGIGMVHQPLSVGKHVITLDVRNTQEWSPACGGGYTEYHNTWNITVKPGE
jgi:hypothetical protein